MVATMDGTPIYTLNEAQFFQPASNAKLFTTAAALALLGSGRRWTTSLDGPPPSGTVLNGDLRLLGGGDANLSGRAIPYLPPAERKRLHDAALERGEPPPPADPLRALEQLADAVKNTGITRISGDLIADDTAWPWEPYPPDWSIDDAVWGYGAPVAALTVNDNQLELTVTPVPRPAPPPA